MSPPPAPFTDGDNEKPTVESNEKSAGSSPSIDPEPEKPQPNKTSNIDVVVDDDKAAATQDAGEYATGAKLLIIVIALVLSVFLFSLDQVCPLHNSLVLLN